MLRSRREETYSHKISLKVIEDLENVVRNLQIRLKSANNEITRLDRESKRANHEREVAYNNLSKMREFKLKYIESLVQVLQSSDIF